MTTLDELICARGEPLPLKRVLGLLRQLARELDALHAQETVHGGLTPAVILVDDDRVTIRTDGNERPGVRFAFQPPEARRHGVPTAGGDQYALALIAYELLVGRSRVSMDEEAGVPVIEEMDLSPAHVLRLGTGPAVNAVLRAATSRDAETRYPTVGEFVDALAAALEHPHPDTPLPVSSATPPRGTAVPPAAPRRPIDRKPYDPAFGSRIITVTGLALAVTAIVSATYYGYYGRTPRFLAQLGSRRGSDDATSALRLVLPGGTGSDGPGEQQNAGAAASEAPRLGYVRISITAGSPAVLLDGRPVGQGSMLLAAEPGIHLIEVRENGRAYSPGSRPVRVARGDTTSAQFSAP